jgi:sterol desaturase/sphingolipid hydroxylase (fatty acid hydroxylase superfamily)
MFESDFVDFFSRTHWSVVPLLYVPAAAVLFGYGVVRVGLGLGVSLALGVAGFMVWSLTEYWLHRTFFHWVPRGRWGERMHFLVHGVHHEWPKDKYRLVMPPAVSVTLFFLFLGLFSLVLGSRLVWPFHAGFVLGYMTYDVTHYYVHHYNPKTRYGLALKKHHMLHHFKNPKSRFGVSSMVWDVVFGTRG